MADSNSRTQVLIAVIGLAGVLGTAVIANWDKIFKKSGATTPVTNPATSSNSGGNEGANKKGGETGKKTGEGGGTKHKVPPAESTAPAPAPAPRTISLGGRIFDQATGTPLSTARLAIEVGNQRQVEVVDGEGRYLFYLTGFAPDDLLTLNVQSPNHRSCRVGLLISEIPSPKHIFLNPAAPVSSGASLGAVIGGLAGGGKGAAVSRKPSASPVIVECPDGKAPASAGAYTPRTDGLPIQKPS